MKKRPAFLLLLIAFFLISLPASAAPPNLEGAWLVSLTSDVTGDEATSAYTFNRAGSMSATVDLPDVSTGHGAWKKVGPKTYTTTFVSFIDDGNNATTTLTKNTARMVVSSDGNDIAVELRFEILVNGTVVQSGTSAGSGVRIVAEDF